MYKVLKPFHTINRRFNAGAEIGPNDIQGEVTFDVWVERGFIDGPKTKPLIAKSDKPEKVRTEN